MTGLARPGRWALLGLGLALATTAHAQFLSPVQKARETPAAFAVRLVALYDPHSRWWRTVSRASDDAFRARVYQEFYDPAFAQLIEDNGALASKRVDGVDLDSDPVCQCQDAAGPLAFKAVVVRGPEAASLRVGSDCEPAAKRCDDYQIRIRRIGGAWKIEDVVDASGSNRAWLTRHNACLRDKALSRAAVERCLR